MEVEIERRSGEPFVFTEGLKCPVCWDYFEKPHTLCCGHTFCLRCLQNLARISRSSKTRTPLDRLRMPCPVCRKKTLVRPILKRRAALNYVIKQVTDDWFNSLSSCAQLCYVTLVSVSSQTDKVDGLDLDIPAIKGSLQENENPEDDISATEEQDVLIYTIDVDKRRRKPKEALHEVLTGVNADENPPVVADDAVADDTVANDHINSASDDNQASSSSGEETDQDLQIGQMWVVVEENHQLRPRMSSITSVSGVLTMLFLELCIVYRGIRRSRSRTILTIFWFINGSVIVYMSRAFLPWMTFYTAIYFIIIYVEVSPGPLFR